MNKKIFGGIAILALSMIPTAMSAQTAEKQGRQCDRKECRADQRCDRKAKQCVNPFEGMNLTDTQKQQLEQLNSSRRDKAMKQRQAAKEQKQAMKKEAREARRTAKRQYLNEVKSIIGEDNYVIYLENIVLDSPQHHKAKKMDKSGGHHARAGKHKSHDKK